MTARLIVGLDNYGDHEPEHGWAGLLDIAEAADRAGIDAVSVVDHVALGGDLADYPYGSFPGGADASWLEPLTTLAAFAGRTTRLRLFTGILIAPLRPGALLAKTVATLDQLSGGRLELGVGTGWLAKEYEAVGLDYAERGRLLDDNLEICHQLWSGGAAAFTSPRLSFTDVHSSPQPVSGARLPIWIGGALHRRNVERIVRFGRGWIPSPTARAKDIVASAAELRAALANAGRDPGELRVRISPRLLLDEAGVPDLVRTFARLPALVADATPCDIFVAHAACGAGRDDPSLFERMAAEFATALSRSS